MCLDAYRASSSSSANNPLSAILERLEKVEEHVLTPSSRSGSDQSPRVARNHLRTSIDRPHEIRVQRVSSTCSPVSPAAVSIATPQTLDSTCALADLDIMALLTDAIAQVQRLRLQVIAKSTLTEGVEIPTERAKEWIDSMFLPFGPFC